MPEDKRFGQRRPLLWNFHRNDCDYSALLIVPLTFFGIPFIFADIFYAANDD